MTFRILLRPVIVGSLAVLFGLFLALGASPAFAQVEGLLPGEDPAPEGETPPTPEGDLLGDLLETGNLEDLLGDLSLDELLSLLDLLGEEAPETPAPVPDAQPAPAQPAAPAPAHQATPQVAQRPVGGVAAGAGGATDNGGTTVPLLALGALTLAGAGAGLTRLRRTEVV